MEQDQSKWVSLWGNAMSIGENRPEGYGKNITLSYPVLCPFEGESLRLTFDNYCGTEAISITRASLLYQGRFYPITFPTEEGGSINYMTIPAKKAVTTCPLPVHVEQNTSFEVRFYLGSYTQMRSTVFASGPLSSGTYAVGDYTNRKEIPITVSRPTNNFYFLSNISILTEGKNRAIVCYGDSITAQAWPDFLKLRCQQEGYSHTSVIRRATSGSRILREYDCLTYQSYGLSGVHRFLHEVPTDGADTIIIQQGINDIIHPVGTEVNPFRPMSDLPTATELIDGLKWYVEKARGLGLKVYVGTLLPIKGWRTYAPFREELKDLYNDFIRTTSLIDGCIDFDLAVRSKKDPTAFAEGYDSGDHLHPSLEGYQAMAGAVPDQLLR